MMLVLLLLQNGTDTDVIAVADAVCTVYKTMVIMEGREGTLEISSYYANAVICADATMVHNADAVFIRQR